MCQACCQALGLERAADYPVQNMLFFHHYLYCGLIFKAKLGKHSMLQNEEVIDQKVGLSSGGWLGPGGGSFPLWYPCDNKKVPVLQKPRTAGESHICM